MREEIETSLAVLVGLPLCDWGRAANMATFGFGGRQVQQSLQPDLVEVAEYAFHVQCHWRIVGPEGIVVGCRDMYYPATGRPDPDFEWDKAGANLHDKLLEAFMAAPRARPLVVEAVSADRLGGLRVALRGEYSIELFPDTAPRDDDEHWRFFLRGDRSKHFVVTSHGIRD